MFNLFGSELLTLIFKKEYQIFYKELQQITVAFSFVGFIKILIISLFSKNDNGYSIILFLGILIMIYFCSMAKDYKEFINIMIYGYAINCIFMFVYTFLIKKRYKE